MKRPDGTLSAYEVRRFPKPLNPGHRPFDGRELTMTYEGGAQKIVVPPDASVSTLVPGTRAQLVPGTPVSLTLDGSGVALRIQVSPKK